MKNRQVIFIGVPYSQSVETMRDATMNLSNVVRDADSHFLPLSPYYVHNPQGVEQDLTNIKHLADAVYLPHPNLLHSDTTERVVRVAMRCDIPVFEDIDSMVTHFDVDAGLDDGYDGRQMQIPITISGDCDADSFGRTMENQLRRMANGKYL